MEVSRVSKSEDGKNTWITVRSKDKSEFLVIHILSETDVMEHWEKLENNLNLTFG